MSNQSTDNSTNKQLSAEQKAVLFDKKTEAPFSGKLLHNKDTGIYHCANCGQPLFDSKHKYDSGSGWPSFWQPVSDSAVKLQPDTTGGMNRTEVICGNCGGHLGHVFTDGPQPTGQRFCVNSAALDFNKKNGQKKKKEDENKDE